MVCPPIQSTASCINVRPRAFRWSRRLLLLLTMLAISVETSAQSVGVNIGWHHSLDAEPMVEYKFEQESNQRANLSAELLFGSIIEGPRQWRFGIRYSWLTLKWTHLDSSVSTKYELSDITYTMRSFLLTFQHRLTKMRESCILFNVSAGLVAVDNGLQPSRCDMPFCNLPDLALTVQPGIEYLRFFYRQLAVRCNVRYCHLIGVKEEIRPFWSGPLVEVGLCLESPPGV